MIKLNYGDVVILENRLYKIFKANYHNRKTGRGIKATLKILRENELNELILKQENKEEMKGGINENGETRTNK